MDDKSKFSLSYLIKGEGKKDWYKAMGNGWRIIVILAVLALFGFTVWKAFFKKPDSSQNIHADAGSNVTVIQNNQKKRLFIPFTEVFVGQESDKKMSTGIRGGVRFEF